MWKQSDRPATYRDPWITYLVKQSGELRANRTVMFAALALQGMQSRGVEITEVLADAMYEIAKKETDALEWQHAQAEIVAESRKPTSVYFIQWGERIKIGCAKDVAERCRSLSLPPSAILATMPGSYRHENALHKRFHASRIKGSEWFHITPELLAYIESLTLDKTSESVV